MAILNPLKFQRDAVDKLVISFLKLWREGRRKMPLVFKAPTGSGKTCMALKVIAERQQPALIVVHTKELMDQWVDRIQSFLGLSSAEFGRIGNGKTTLGEFEFRGRSSIG